MLPYLVGRRFIVINTSPSVAPGLYVRSATEPTVGAIVDFAILRYRSRLVSMSSTAQVRVERTGSF